MFPGTYQCCPSVTNRKELCEVNVCVCECVYLNVGSAVRAPWRAITAAAWLRSIERRTSTLPPNMKTHSRTASISSPWPDGISLGECTPAIIDYLPSVGCCKLCLFTAPHKCPWCISEIEKPDVKLVTFLRSYYAQFYMSLHQSHPQSRRLVHASVCWFCLRLSAISAMNFCVAFCTFQATLLSTGTGPSDCDVAHRTWFRSNQIQSIRSPFFCRGTDAAEIVSKQLSIRVSSLWVIVSMATAFASQGWSRWKSTPIPLKGGLHEICQTFPTWWSVITWTTFTKKKRKRWGLARTY